MSTVAIHYDSLGRPYQTSNPYSSETPLLTTTSYDALGRPLSIAPPSGGSTIFSYFDNSVAVTDPAGKQRRSYTDALGRLIQVDEPATGQTTAGVAATAVITINGAEQVNTTSGTKATGWFKVSGTDEWVLDCPPDFLCSPRTSPKLWDSGEVTVSINGVQAGVGYGQGSTAAGLASSLGSQLNPHPVMHSDNGAGTITVTADTPGPNYPLSGGTFTNDPGDFGSGSFSVAVSGPFLTGGVYPVTTHDSGTVTVSIGAFQASTTYNQNFNTTALALAQDLASRINIGASPVTATVNQISPTQVQLLLTANTVGTQGNVNVSIPNTVSYQFSITTSSGTAATAMTGGADPQKTTYAYDLLNDLTQVNQGQQVRTYQYDQLARLKQATTPESGTATYSYLNSAGALCSGNPSAVCFSTDARGVIVTNTYADPLSRLTQVDYSVGASGVPATPSVSYLYGTSIAQNNNGRLLKMTDGLGSETYSYDTMGRVTQVSRAVTGTTLPFNIGYGYNQADQLTSITYPSGRVVQQNYDGIGRLGSILSGTTTYLSVPATGGYNSAQLPLALNYGSGVAGAFQYNDHLQLSSLNYSLNGVSLLNLSDNYLDAQGHNNGQIQGINDSRGDAFSTLFSYDPLGRLIHAQTKDLTSANTWNLLWNYDIYGNRLSQSAGTPSGTLTTGAPSLTIDPATNRIAPGSGFNYDPAGNVIQDPSYGYTYNGEGELVKSVRSSDGMTATDAYDGHRWRMEKTAAGATTVYIYSGSKVLAEYAAGAAPTAPSTEYVYSGGSLLVTLSGTSVTYHYPDHLSNRLETNSAGTVTRTFGHLPFGETWYETGTPDKWKFTGYERDTSESGLDYAMNRMYSSGYGRFQMPDLLEGTPWDPQSLNRYPYVGGDPLNFVDPSGLSQHPILYVPPQPDLRSYEFEFLQMFFDAVDAQFQAEASFFEINTPVVCNDAAQCQFSVTGHWSYTLPDFGTYSSSFAAAIVPNQPDNWWSDFFHDFVSNFSLASARKPGEKFSDCVSRVRQAGGAVTTATDAVSGAGLLTWAGTTSFGTTTVVSSTGRGAGGWNVIGTSVEEVPNLSLAQGAAISAANNGLIPSAAASLVGKAAGTLSKVSGLATAVALGLEGGALGACR